MCERATDEDLIRAEEARKVGATENVRTVMAKPMRLLLFVLSGGILAGLLYVAGVYATTWKFWAIFGCAHLMGALGYGPRESLKGKGNAV